MAKNPNKQNSGIMIVLNAFAILFKAILKFFLVIINGIYKIEKKLLAAFNKKFSYKASLTLTILTTCVVIFTIGFGTYAGIKAYQNEMKRQYQQKLIDEENARLEAERQAKEAEKARIAQEEQKAKELSLKKDNMAMNLKTLNKPSSSINLNILYQYPELPSGCECVSLSNILNYYGFILDKFYLVDNYLIYDNTDFVNYYCGDPYSDPYGGLIMAPGLTQVAKNFLIDKNSSCRVYNISGLEFEELFAYVERGIPVQIWTSLDMGDLGNVYATDGNYTYYINSHSVVLTGFDRNENTVTIADPIIGSVKYNIQTAKEIYNLQNKQAVIVISDEILTKIVNEE